MSGKDAIIEKIIEDARAIANATNEDASAKGMEIVRLAQEDAKIYREKHIEESAKEREEIIRRKLTVANLEVKKMLLAAKQEVLTKTFGEAADAIRNDARYETLLKNMLRQASDGDTVVFSEKDKDIVNASWLTAEGKKLGKVFVFGGYGAFNGGIKASGKGSDKNMTLETELAAVREEHEPKIAAILFGE